MFLMSILHLVTLLTDFGRQDIYVGVMKGVIASINPQIQTIISAMTYPHKTS